MHNMSLPPHYQITTTFWKRNYEVTGPQSLFVENSQLKPGKADLTFHANTKEGPILALSRYKHFSSDIEIGLSEPQLGHRSVRWDSLHRDGWRSSRYRFTTHFNGRPESFTWHSTHKKSLRRGGSLEMVHDRTGAIVAVFDSHCGFKSSDHVLTINTPADERFHLLVVMTCITLVEKRKRTQDASAAAAGSSASASAAAVSA